MQSDQITIHIHDGWPRLHKTEIEKPRKINRVKKKLKLRVKM